MVKKIIVKMLGAVAENLQEVVEHVLNAWALVFTVIFAVLIGMNMQASLGKPDLQDIANAVAACMGVWIGWHLCFMFAWALSGIFGILAKKLFGKPVEA